MGHEVIRFENVSFSYPLGRVPFVVRQTSVGGRFLSSGGKTSVGVLEDFSLSIHSGERVALVGRNGSGKSTILRLMAGVFQPQRGKITIEGRVSTILNMSAGLLMRASGYENIRLRCRLMEIDNIDEVTADVESFTELGSFLNLPLSQYSAGMRMRLAFALATNISPDILIMDEWVQVGDSEFKEKALARLTKLTESSSTLIVASHNKQLIAEFCNRIIALERGTIVRQGPVSEFPGYSTAAIQKLNED